MMLTKAFDLFDGEKYSHPPYLEELEESLKPLMRSPVGIDGLGTDWISRCAIYSRSKLFKEVGIEKLSEARIYAVQLIYRNLKEEIERNSGIVHLDYVKKIRADWSDVCIAADLSLQERVNGFRMIDKIYDFQFTDGKTDADNE